MCAGRRGKGTGDVLWDMGLAGRGRGMLWDWGLGGGGRGCQLGWRGWERYCGTCSCVAGVGGAGKFLIQNSGICKKLEDRFHKPE